MSIDVTETKPRSYVELAVKYRNMLEEHPTKRGKLLEKAMAHSGNNQQVALDLLERAYVRLAKDDFDPADPRHGQKELSVQEFIDALEKTFVQKKTPPDTNRGLRLVP